MIMLQKLLCLCLSLTFCLNISAEESRILASIADVENKLEVLQRINILSANIESVNIVREHFMKKYIKEFKAKESLSQKDVDAFRKDLDIVLNSTKTLKAKTKRRKRHPASWESPKELLTSFSKKERKEMDGYFGFFNKEVFPLLEEGMNKRDKQQIVTGLTKWLDIGQGYLQFIQKHIDKLKQKA